MDIQIKRSKELYGTNEVHYLYLDGKKQRDKFVPHKDSLSAFNALSQRLFLTIIKADCLDLPEKLDIDCMISNKRIISMAAGQIGFISFHRLGKDFIITLDFSFYRNEIVKMHLNPVMVIKYAAAWANKNGMQDCRFYDSGSDAEDGSFTYRSKAAGTIDSKIKEAAVLINKALNAASQNILDHIKKAQGSGF